MPGAFCFLALQVGSESALNWPSVASKAGHQLKICHVASGLVGGSRALQQKLDASLLGVADMSANYGFSGTGIV